MKIDMKMWRRAAFIAILTTTFATAACGDDVESKGNSAANNTAENSAVNSIEVVGTWDTQFDSTETITEQEWNSSTIVEFDNAENEAILQSPPDDEFTPDQYSKVVWTEPESDVFYYCTVDFGLETLEAAQDSMATADDSDPANGGCNMFPWTMMTLAQ